MSKINHIFITHCHGDHCYGIYGFLHSLAMQGRKDPMHIYGPVGIKEMVSTVLRVSGK